MPDFIERDGRRFHKRAHEDCYATTFRIFEDRGRGALLDLAAGSGYTSFILDGMGFAVTATDIHAAQFDVPGVECRSADLNEPIPFPDASFPSIVALEILEHLEAPRKFFREIERLLTSGGTAVVSTPNITSLRSKFRFLFRDEFHLFYDTHRRLKDPFYEGAAGHIAPLPHWLIRHFIEEAGLKLVEVQCTRETFWLRNRFISTNLLLQLAKP